MSATPDDLFARLERLNIETTTHTHPPLFSVEESQKLRGNLPGGHCKNLFLKDKKGKFWLIVTLEDQRVDIKALGKILSSARLSFGKPDLLMKILGVTPGSVTPFALMNDREIQVQVVLDSRMMERDLLNYHPLTNHMTTSICPSGLQKFIEDCGHTPVTVTV